MLTFVLTVAFDLVVAIAVGLVLAVVLFMKRIADFTKAPSTANALETLIKYYYANRQEDTDWVVLPVANFDAYFGSTSFSKKRLTELVKSGAIEHENSYNVSRYRLNEAFCTELNG